MGRGIEFNEKLKEERKALILKHAVKLFAINGLAATKISHIAAASGMSQGLMYHYYKSKEEIYIELIRQAFQKMNSGARALEALSATPKEKIRIAIEQLVHGFKESEYTGYYHLLIAQATASKAIPDEAKAIIQKENKIPYEVMSRIIEEGQKTGEMNNYDPDDLALVFWTTIKGLALHRVTHGELMRFPDPEILMKLFY